MRAPNRPLKVLHIGKYFPPHHGGMETYLRDIMAALSRRGVDNQALVHRSELSLRSTEEEVVAGGQNLRVSRAAVWIKLLFTPLSPAFPLRLNHLIREFKPQILHLHMPNASAFWVLLLPTARRIPWTIHWHSDVPVSEHKLSLRLVYHIYQPFERALLKRARRIIVTSRAYLETSAPLAEFQHKCDIVPLGIDPEHLGAPPQTPKKPNRTLRAIAIGRLTYYKGFEYLIRAAALVPSVHVDLVGSGELDVPLRQLARDLQLGDRVTFHGAVDAAKLGELLANSDCLCLPSIERSEAFGLVLLEAMYFGKATIASNVNGSGMTWVVQAGYTGELVPPEDAESLAESLRILETDRAKLARYGEAGRERFDGMFHIDRSAAPLEAALSRSIDFS